MLDRNYTTNKKGKHIAPITGSTKLN